MRKTSILSSMTIGAMLLTASLTPNVTVNAMADDGEKPIQYKAKTNDLQIQKHSIVYQVKKGDTLSSIAIKFKTSYQEIMKTNNLQTTALSINQKLTLPNSSDNKTNQTQSISTYTVQQGDTLSSIANRNNTSYQQLMQANQLTTTKLSIGQKLTIGLTPTAPQNLTASTSHYTVQLGDTLSTIAKKFNTTSNDLMHLNGLSSTLIYENQQLEVQATTNRSYRSAFVKTSNNKQVKIEEKATTSSNLAQAAKIALSQLGVPYGYGQSSPNQAFDCSGLIAYALGQAGYNYGRMSAASYYSIGTTVNSPQYGDLVFFSNTYKSGISHVGFYIGNGQMVSAAGDQVQIDSINSSYWSSHFTAYKRF